MTDTTAPTITVTPLEVTLELDSASPTLLDGVSTDDGSTVTATGTVEMTILIMILLMVQMLQLL